MLKYDPIQWLMRQDDEAAVRARCALGLAREGDDTIARKVAERFAKAQLSDGSFDHSPMKTACVVCLLADMAPELSAEVMSQAGEFLLGLLEAQPGYRKAARVRPGALTAPWDLGGFFGACEATSDAYGPTDGACEMNIFREFEPLLGPKSPVRTERRSSFDRPGPGSCYDYGLVPLCYIIEALCRSEFHADKRLKPAINVLLAVQRQSGGWCRNPGGGFPCTLPAVRAIGAHPKLRQTPHAEAALAFLRASQTSPLGSKDQRQWRGAKLFAALHAVARFDLPLADEILTDGLKAVAGHQRQNGSFGTPCRTERVAAVIAARRRLEMKAR